MSMLKKNVLLVLAAVIIAVVPLLVLKNAEFGGSDDAAEGVIAEVNPDYVPWFNNLFELPSGEVESLLFCVQAGLGAGICGFILGRMTAKPKPEKTEKGPAGKPDAAHG